MTKKNTPASLPPPNTPPSALVINPPDSPNIDPRELEGQEEQEEQEGQEGQEEQEEQPEKPEKKSKRTYKTPQKITDRDTIKFAKKWDVWPDIKAYGSEIKEIQNLQNKDLNSYKNSIKSIFVKYSKQLKEKANQLVPNRGGSKSDYTSSDSDSDTSSDSSSDDEIMSGGSGWETDIYYTEDESSSNSDMSEDEQYYGGNKEVEKGQIVEAVNQEALTESDVIDLLTINRTIGKGITFLKKYEKKLGEIYDADDDYTKTLNVINQYLNSFGFCVDENNIHIINFIWEQTGRNSDQTKILVMLLINKNNKYKFCSHSYEVENVHSKFMFCGIASLYSCLIKETPGYSYDQMSNVDYSYLYINKIFQIISNIDDPDVQVKFFKKYLKYGFSAVTIALYNKIKDGKGSYNKPYDEFESKHFELDEKLLYTEMYSKMTFLYYTVSEDDIQQKKCFYDPRKLQLLFSSDKNTGESKGAEQGKKMKDVEFLKKSRFSVDKFTKNIFQNKIDFIRHKLEENILTILLAREKNQEKYMFGGGIDKKHNGKLEEFAKGLDARLEEYKMQEGKKEYFKNMENNEKIEYLKQYGVNIKDEEKKITIQDIYNLGDIFITGILLRFIMNLKSTLYFGTKRINIKENGYKKHDINIDNTQTSMAIQNYAFEFVSDDGGYLGFCCDKGSFGNDSNETKSLSKYQKFFHLFKTIGNDIEYRRYYRKPNVHFTLRISSDASNIDPMHNKIDAKPLDKIEVRNELLFSTSKKKWYKKLFERSEETNSKKKISNLTQKISKQKYERNKKMEKMRKNIDKQRTEINILTTKKKTLSGSIQKSNIDKQIREKQRKIRDLKRDKRDKKREFNASIDGMQSEKREIVADAAVFDRDFVTTESKVKLNRKVKIEGGLVPFVELKRRGKNSIPGIERAGQTCWLNTALQILLTMFNLSPELGTKIIKRLETNDNDRLSSSLINFISEYNSVEENYIKYGSHLQNMHSVFDTIFGGVPTNQQDTTEFWPYFIEKIKGLRELQLPISFVAHENWLGIEECMSLSCRQHTKMAVGDVEFQSNITLSIPTKILPHLKNKIDLQSEIDRWADEWKKVLIKRVRREDDIVVGEATWDETSPEEAQGFGISVPIINDILPEYIGISLKREARIELSEEDRQNRDKYSEEGRERQFDEWKRVLAEEELAQAQEQFAIEKSFHETKMRENLNYVDVTPLHIPENNIYSVFDNNYELVAIGVHLNSNNPIKKSFGERDLQVQVAAGGHYIAEVKRKVKDQDKYFTVSDSSVHSLGRDETPFDINNRTWQMINTNNPKIIYVLLKKVDGEVE